MGKEQDLLHAAKNGNVAQIERILGQRNRRSGIHRYVLAGRSASVYPKGVRVSLSVFLNQISVSFDLQFYIKECES